MGVSVTIKVGARGGNSGSHWDNQGETRIRQIFVHHGTHINSIQTTTVADSSKRSAFLSEKHGGDGDMFETVTLDYPSEFLTCVSGYYGSGGAKFGQEEGTRFCFRMGNKEGSFGGFHGRSDSSNLYSIGIYVKPICSRVERTGPDDHPVEKHHSPLSEVE